MIDTELVRDLRKMAARGTSVCEMATIIIDRLEVNPDGRVQVIAHLPILGFQMEPQKHKDIHTPSSTSLHYTSGFWS